ncbi:39S ribosomal protein L40, mitochondrial [Eufriesea mexicana]|uniref:Large ribosomal subunit protein mL40 n=1 Tax=Eufriesea mexicana TaxID=516756 RepID=A0A310SS69_9HYME|nr:PREDICTED: 39S ribosomal protein L40, mitochondrial [Eufriesea mexicana]OAD58382.1 39S ribosomal protein L40, mitochondrial [Eufriesea mexicana]
MIGILNLANATFRSSSCLVSNSRNFSIFTNPLCFRATQVLLAEPMKKKKKLDPAIIRARDERKKKRIEKRIRSLQKFTDHMKPIYEIDVLPELLKNDERIGHLTTSLSDEEVERRRLLQREWSLYKQDQWLKDLRVIKSIITSQEIALKELKAVSKQLYKEAVEFDHLYIPYSVTGPVDTPSIQNYDSPDGEYIETTVKYIGE